jgi:hypothetical protein
MLTAFAALVVFLFGGRLVAAKAAGVWRTSVGNEEYVRRVRDLDAPIQPLTGCGTTE